MQTQQTQNIFITFVQRRPNVFDVGPALCKCYKNVLCLLGSVQMWLMTLHTLYHSQYLQLNLLIKQIKMTIVGLSDIMVHIVRFRLQHLPHYLYMCVYREYKILSLFRNNNCTQTRESGKRLFAEQSRNHN